MIIDLTTKDKTGRWFAWRPVWVDHKLVWLEYVERYYGHKGKRVFWEYRLPTPTPRASFNGDREDAVLCGARTDERTSCICISTRVASGIRAHSEIRNRFQVQNIFSLSKKEAIHSQQLPAPTFTGLNKIDRHFGKQRVRFHSKAPSAVTAILLPTDNQLCNTCDFRGEIGRAHV